MSASISTHGRRSRATLALPALGTVLVLAFGGCALPAAAASSTVVISQVYGGGGNSGATYRNDFIELYNRGATAVSLSGWSIQYASASGSTWSKTNLTGTLQPGQYYLIQQAQGSGGTQALPTPDATGTIAMAAIAAKVALRSNTTLLSCSAGCATQSGVVDFVGYGSTASSYEGAPTGDLSNVNAALRNGSGCTETDNNSSDFSIAAAAPRNSAAPFGSCSGGGLRIRDIQGASHLSPKNGQSVANVEGIVTAKTSSGFYLQDQLADADPATSEGILVYTAAAPGVNVGDKVRVGGNVSEFRPGGSGGTNNLTITEIVSPVVSFVSSGNPLPAPVVIGTGGRVPPQQVIDNDANGSVETGGSFDATSDGIDFYESLEGMRVQLNAAVVVGPRNANGEIPVIGDSGANAGLRTPRGGIVIAANDFNPERVIIDDALQATPTVKVGDSFSSVIGVMDYSFGNFKLLATQALSAVTGSLAPEVTTPQGSNQLAVASFNVENLDPNDPQSKFDALAAQIVANLKAPDIVGLMEMQDNNGATNNSTVSASTTFSKLIAAIQSAGGPTYQYRQINPVDDQDGGEPGGNIRVGFLFNPARVSFIDRAGGTSTNANAVLSGPQLQYSPGRIDPQNSAFANSRKPLAGELSFNGRKLFVIANHFNSKGGDQPLFGRFQPPTLSSETQRQQQASVVAGFVQDILALDANANVIVLGDLNDFEFSSSVTILKNAGLHDLVETLPAAERYTYVFEGNSQVLDHIMVSANLRFNAAVEYDVVHVNAEFVNPASDHEPEVARFTLP